MANKLINLVALTALVLLACSFGSTPANALSIDSSPNHARHLGHHQLLAKKKRADSRRCKPRPSSSVAVSSSKAVVPTSTKKVVPTTTPKAVAPATTKAPAPPVNTVPASNSGAKVGLAWPNGDDPSLKNFKTSKVSKIYTWGPWKPSGADALGLQFAPMLWGTKQITQFQQLVKRGYAQYALGFNEPDHGGQANLDPGYAATLWKQYLEPLKSQGYQLISPAVTSGSSGIPWLQSFMGACSGCTFDAVAVHWYGTNPQDFINYVQKFHSTFGGKDIWVTEFACQNFGGGAQCSAEQVRNFMDTVTGWMDSTPYVKAYFAFGVMHDMVGVNPLNQLMAGNGQPTDLGWDYLT